MVAEQAITVKIVIIIDVFLVESNPEDALGALLLQGLSIRSGLR